MLDDMLQIHITLVIFHMNPNFLCHFSIAFSVQIH